MAEITLFLTRKPKEEFTQMEEGYRNTTDIPLDSRDPLYGRTEEWKRLSKRFSDEEKKAHKGEKKRVNGLWGTLGVMQGPKVLSAQLLDVAATRLSEFAGIPEKATWYIQFANRVLEYRTNNSAPPVVDAFKEYTTVERYRGDYGGVGGDDGYIILQPRPDIPYGLRTGSGNATVQQLGLTRPSGTHSGNCIYIEGTTRPKEDQILIHEAPTIGWVVGCIGPRPLGRREVFNNEVGNPAEVAFMEIYNQMNAKGGKIGKLIVLDWG